MPEWTPSSWRAYPVKQQPVYPDAVALEAAAAEVRRLPPLVTASEVDELRAAMAEVALGKRFLLQGGDCAERFMDCSAEPIEKKLKILLQMSLVLTWGARVPTLRIARMAGQFAKPRSKDTEVVGGVELPAFRGDNVNSFDVTARVPDPARMVAGYFHSAATMNYTRAALASGLADLKSSSHWDLGFVQDPAHRAQYNAIRDRILSALDFMRVCGVAEDSALKTAAVYVSHEGLQLTYEEALTRPVARHVSARQDAPLHHVHPPAGGSAGGAASSPAAGGAPPVAAAAAAAAASVASGVSHYNLGTHFLWIGDRTRQLDHAHVEYCRGVANPIGIKAGPASDPAELVAVIRRLWPHPAAAPGKIAIITRMGASGALAKLPALIAAVHAAALGSPVVWVCDPMHGNTTLSSNGYKTREFDDILCELKHSFEAHAAAGSILGGVHFELTGENVTECTGGPQKLLEADLPLRYTTYCDPRLNYAQGMELAFLVGTYLADAREGGADKGSARLAPGRGFSPSLRAADVVPGVDAPLLAL